MSYADMGVECEDKMSTKVFAVGKKIQNALAVFNVKPRPLAGPGVWLLFLLPGIIVINKWKYSNVSDVYSLSSDLSVGLLTGAVTLLLAICSSDLKKPHSFHTGMVFPFMFTSSRLYLLHGQGLLFSVYCGMLTSYGFIWCFVSLMRSCPLCFTFGEAAIVTQAVILFMFSSMENIYESLYKTFELDMEVATIILQVGMLGVIAICTVLYTFPYLHSTGPFYGLVLGVLCLIVLPTLHFLLKQSPVLWILSLVVSENKTTVWLVLYWMFCVAVATFSVAFQVQKGQHASTSVRKYFHVLAVAVYIPGLINACCLLYLASVIILALFVVLELVRLFDIPPLGSSLREGFTVYADEKDAGNLALTPIYLLVGCSLPMWLHPVGCSSPNSLLSLSSGLLSVGVGDTLASSIGSNFGRHKWPGTHKTIEGTIACVVGQLATVLIMYSLDSSLHFPSAIAQSKLPHFFARGRKKLMETFNKLQSLIRELFY